MSILFVSILFNTRSLVAKKEKKNSLPDRAHHNPSCQSVNVVHARTQVHTVQVDSVHLHVQNK